MKELRELKKNIEEINTQQSYEDIYCDIYNYTYNYMNDTNDYNLEYLFDDFIDYDTAEEMAKKELNYGGLERINCFLSDCYLNSGFFRVDGYGNLENIDKNDIDCLIDEIMDYIKENIEE